MCWNSQVSLNTFLFSTFGLLFAIFNNYDPKILIFSYVFSFIQFVEFNLWKNINNVSQNELWSKIGFFSILAQPLASINLIENIKLKSIFLISYLIFISLNNLSLIKFKTTIGKNKHLAWNWLNSNLSAIIIWSVFLLAPLFIEKYYIIGFIGLITLLSSLYFYDEKTFGSMWCWSANIIWLIIIAQSSGLFSKGCL